MTDRIIYTLTGHTNPTDILTLADGQAVFGAGASYATRSALAARSSPAVGDMTALTEAGREGTFVVDLASNWTAAIAADTLQGLFVASTADVTKVYVRKFTGSPHINWWGAKGDYNGATGTDNGSVFTAAMVAIQSLAQAEPDIGAVAYLNRSLSLKDGGRYYTTTPFNIVSSLGYVDFTGSEIIVPTNTYGIIINEANTDAEATRTVGPFPFFCKLINPAVRGHNGTDLTKHGIWMRRTAFIFNPQVQFVSGDGIRIGDNGALTDGNQNGWHIDNAYISRCGGNGIKAIGSNANAGFCTNYNIELCGRFGWEDASVIGNTWEGQSANNGIVLSGVNTIPAFTYYLGYNWAIKAGQEANTTTAPSTAAYAIWIRMATSAGGDPAVPAWTSGMTMKAGGDFSTVYCNGVVRPRAFYQEGGTCTAQCSLGTIMRDPAGAFAATGGTSEVVDVDGCLATTTGYRSLNYTADGSAHSVAQLGGASIGGADTFGQWKDQLGHTWFWQAGGGYLKLSDNTAGISPIAISIAGGGFNFGRSTEQVGVLFSQAFALGFSNSGRIVDMNSAAPTSGYHAAGELVFNNGTVTAVSTTSYWQCTAAGTPGTWNAHA